MGTKPPSTHWGHHFTRVGMVALITPDHHRGKVSATGTDAYSVEGYTGAALVSFERIRMFGLADA